MTGYIQVQLGGKIRGVKFGNASMYTYSKLIGAESPEEISKKVQQNPIVSAAKLVYSGLIAQCDWKEVEPEFTLEDVKEWVDEISTTEINRIMSAFEETVGKNSESTQMVMEAYVGNGKGSKKK